ncbi:biotin-dependent carboxyltransferase family protein [Sinomonas sp.]|uniref:5-oxoprolinase subunit C family protein n=1 Tax=Sinomonas sp. TaxID=1914986 RepID=UPI003F80893E
MTHLHGFEILSAGPLTLVEDLGRRGAAGRGLSPSGALDREALRLANSIVGNQPDAAGLEVLSGGLRFRALAPLTLAVTGAEGSLTVGGLAAKVNARVDVPAGEVVSLGTVTRGLRYCVAFAGGVAATQLWGSRSADTLSGEGPTPLRPGDLLEVGPPAAEVGSPAAEVGSPAAEVGPHAVFRRPPRPDQTLAIRVTPGPRLGWFVPGTWQQLIRSTWRLSPESNRIGARLLGRPLQRERMDELPSEGMVRGAIQVPPSGLPTVFLADHPVTGGYPVAAVVRSADLDLFAQARPGQPLRFLAG